MPPPRSLDAGRATVRAGVHYSTAVRARDRLRGLVYARRATLPGSRMARCASLRETRGDWQALTRANRGRAAAGAPRR